MYQIVYKKSAAKVLTKLPTKTAQQFLNAFEKLAARDSHSVATLDIKKLENRAGFRLRIGDYRAIYQVWDEQLIIEVIKIGSRGDVYK